MRLIQRFKLMCLVLVALLAAACDDITDVSFEQPFPQQSPDLEAFPVRFRGVYTAADSSKSLCVGATAVWRQELRSHMLSRRQLDSLHHRLTADSTYRDGQRLHYLRLVGPDSVRDSWLWTDTVFTLAGAGAGKLRRFQGRYYLNTPYESADTWDVQRLEIAEPNLAWQQLGQDTLRLLALDPTTVRYRRAKGISHFHLAPATTAENRRIGRYAGLWETLGEYRRRH